MKLLHPKVQAEWDRRAAAKSLPNYRDAVYERARFIASYDTAQAVRARNAASPQERTRMRLDFLKEERRLWGEVVDALPQ